MLETLHPFAIIFFLGLLIGIERERAHAEGVQAMGVRSFILIGLLGTLAARIGSPVVIAAISTAVLGGVALGYLRSTRPGRAGADIGLTTELAAVAVYALGFLAFRERALALLLGVVELLVLFSRAWLHRFAREILQPRELNAAVLLLVWLVVVVPFLPDRAVDPWSLIQPRKLGLLVGMIAGMEFLGYAASRAFGARRGLMLTGFLGGLVSSTATVITMSGRVRAQPESAGAAAAAVTLATVASLVELLVILLSGATRLGTQMSLPLLAMIAVGAALGWLTGGRGPRVELDLPSQNPLDVRGVLKLSGALAVLLTAVAGVRRALGTRAMMLVAFIGGLFELHGVSLATSVLFAQSGIGLGEAETAVAAAVAASFVSKTALAWALGRSGAYGLRYTVAVLAMAGAGLLAHWAI